ncbi:MAG: ArsR/SmtB family transcription factor [Myxococcota bacterium]|nr:helix-turn-helix domain-containing protein [Myxococcota bacterium]
MRPLFHPALSDITVEGILHALSDPVRFRIFVDLAKDDSTKTCSAYLEVSNQPVPKSTLSQHFKVLREAGLVRSERRGVEMHNLSRCAEIATRFPGLLPAIIEAHKTQNEQKSRGKKRTA